MEKTPELVDELKPKSDTKNVPAEILPIVDDILSIVDDIYGGENNLGALYWEGSAPRGDFIPGKSDVDFVLICKSVLPEDHVERRMELIAKLDPKWQEFGVRRIDMIAMSEGEIHDANRAKQVFILATDSVKIAGDADYDFSFGVPGDRANLAKLLVGNLEKSIDKAEGPKWCGWLVKVLIRDIYGLAISRGATYERRISDYGSGVKEFAPELLGEFQELLKLEGNTHFTDTEVIDIFMIANDLLEKLRTEELIK